DAETHGSPGPSPEARTARDGGGVRGQAVELLDRVSGRDAIARLRPHAIYHCAGAAHVGESWNRTVPTFAINVRGTHHLLDSLRESRIECRVLIPSSAMIYRPADEALTEDHPLVPESPYGVS